MFAKMILQGLAATVLVTVLSFAYAATAPNPASAHHVATAHHVEGDR